VAQDVHYPTTKQGTAMKKVIATLIAGLFASAAFAQAPATPATPATPAAAATPATAATKAAPAAKAEGDTTKEATTAKAEPKHKKAKAHKASKKTAPAAQGSSTDVKPEAAAPAAATK
jgi:hypothetical protein